MGKENPNHIEILKEIDKRFDALDEDAYQILHWENLKNETGELFADFSNKSASACQVLFERCVNDMLLIEKFLQKVTEHREVVSRIYGDSFRKKHLRRVLGLKTETALLKKYFDWERLIDEMIAKYKKSPKESQLSPEKDLPNNFKPKAGLDKIVYKDFIFQFGEIERELVSRKFLNEQSEWIENKKTFCEFLVVILGFGYTAKKVSDTNVRYFFEKRYGKPKKYLSAMFSKSKRSKFEIAIITFHFISAPQEKKEVTPHHHKGMTL